MNPKYQAIMDVWQKPLLKKKIKRERKLLNPIVPTPDQSEVMYVHDKDAGVTIPPNPDQMFAVVRL